MFETPPGERPARIAFLLLPRFSLMSLLSGIEPLRGANRTLGRDAYAWEFLSYDGAPVKASNGIPIAADRSIDEVESHPTVCVLASYRPLAAVDARLRGWLRRLHRRGSVLVGVETGPEVLADAGLLAGRRVTLHWETLAAFREAHPDVDARDTLFEIDGPFVTCSGGTAAMDLMLHVLAERHSQALAASVSEQFLHSEIRAPQARQRMPADRRAGVAEPELVRVTEVMQRNLEQPLPLDALARRAGVGKRRMHRLFVRALGEPPQRYYLRLRLERARLLLRHGDLPAAEIAPACGFGSAAYFSRAYRRRFGHSPREERMRRRHA